MNLRINPSVKQASSIINANEMSTDELRKAIMVGYEDIEQGNKGDAITAFGKFCEEHI